MKVPATKNGPKGTSDLSFFFLAAINPMPTADPMKKDRKRAAAMPGKPKIRPIKKANFISPSPIHFPREIRTIAAKKAAAPRALKIEELKIENSLKIRN